MRRFLMIALLLGNWAILGWAQQEAQSTDSPISADQFTAKKIIPPTLVNNVMPILTNEAMQNHFNGSCIVSLIVDIQGNPQNSRIVRCTDPSFETSSLATVAQYRFKPATTHDGQLVPITIRVVIQFNLPKAFDSGMPIRHVFSSPPGTTSTEPDADGVYPLTKMTTLPKITRFSDEGYGDAAFLDTKEYGACDIVLTISTKGKASDALVTHCERASLEKPAVLSLLNSKYKPGSVNGKAVPIRASVHLEYGNVNPK